MPQYHTPDEDFISESLRDDTYEHLSVPLYNMSALLGDTKGLVSKSMAKIIRNNVSIKPPGILDSIDKETLEESTEYDSLLGRDAFYPEMGHSSFLVYNNIHRNVALGEEGNSSPLLHFIDTPENERSAICFIYVCCLDLYRQILKHETEGKINMPKQDIRKIDSNIRWVSARLDANTQHELLTVLRELQRIIMYILTLNFLFEE